jgi:ABC-type multidrug transport system ATPase subunit
LSIILEITGLTKHYGRIHAVDGIDLTVQRGQVFGLLGPNGSGKTTTLGIILDIVRPTAGIFRWFGEQPSAQIRRRLGASLEQPIFYPYLSAVNNLRVNARIKDVSFDDFERVLKIVNLFDRKDDKFRTYSLGMKQRLAIASVLIGQPEVLILDEPTNGLDPQGIFEIRSLITRIGNEGMTILLASHLLDEVQKVCSHLAVMQHGKKLFSGSVEEIMNDVAVVELSSNNLEILAMALQSYDGVNSITKEGRLLVVKVQPDITPGDINEFLIDRGVVLTHLSKRKKTLEQHFFEILQQSQ